MVNPAIDQNGCSPSIPVGLPHPHRWYEERSTVAQGVSQLAQKPYNSVNSQARLTHGIVAARSENLKYRAARQPESDLHTLMSAHIPSHSCFVRKVE